jgi:hypothetical protein
LVYSQKCEGLHTVTQHLSKQHIFLKQRKGSVLVHMQSPILQPRRHAGTSDMPAMGA